MLDESIRNKINALAKLLAFTEHDLSLLITALTHRSVGNNNNERLEFLGDSVLNFIIGAELFRLFPKADEGTLTCLRAKLVRQETLAEIAEELKLGECLQLGPGERKTGGHQRASILADALEAVIGAKFCSVGFLATQQMVLQQYAKKLQMILTQKVDKDPKTQLQELLQAKRLQLPEYEVIKITGAAHEQIFYVACRVVVLPEAIEGCGESRRKAEQDAAAKVLTIITKQL